MTDPRLLPLLSFTYPPKMTRDIGGTGDLRYASTGSSSSRSDNVNGHHLHHQELQRQPDEEEQDAADDDDGEPTLLLSLIEDGLWTDAARRARDHPTEASRVSPDGRGTPLHLACMNDAPPSLVDALVRAHPPATSVADDDGWTPLHTACYFDAGHEVVKRLLLADPSVINATDAEGRTPLGLLHFVTASRWRDGVAAAASAADEEDDEEGEDETGHHHHHHHHPARRRSSVLSMDADADQHRDRTMSEADDDHPLLRNDADVRRIWRKACNLIMAGYHGTVDESELARRKHKFRLLHACAGLSDCPADFLKLAVKIHPEQLSERDEAGNVPLHVSAAAKVVVAGDTEKEAAAAATTTSTTTPTTTASTGGPNATGSNPEGEGKTDEVFHPMEFLVNANPSAAAVRNFKQKLPLHLSVALNVAAGVGIDPGSTDARQKRRRKRWGEGVGAVLRAYRAAIVEGVERTGLYPFMKAAVGAGAGSTDDDEPHLDTIYELLRACPELERFNKWPTPRTRSAAAACRACGGCGGHAAGGPTAAALTGSSSADAAEGITVCGGACRNGEAPATAAGDGGRGIGTSSAHDEDTGGGKTTMKTGRMIRKNGGCGGRKRRRSSTSDVEG